MKLVIGLGNPGREYQGTRHNVGFEVLRRVREEFKNQWTEPEQRRLKIGGEVIGFETSERKAGGEAAVLVQPMTFMNNSGQGALAAAKIYGAGPGDCLVVCDDVHLPLGKLRVRDSGSSGGQNGLASVLEAFGSESVPRLRLGVGSAPTSKGLRDYVLAKFLHEEVKMADAMAVNAAAAVMCWLDFGLEKVMNEYN